jgi:hypothetical protein
MMISMNAMVTPMAIRQLIVTNGASTGLAATPAMAGTPASAGSVGRMLVGAML